MILELDTEVCPRCGMDLRVDGLDHAFSRGRFDKSFFWHFFMQRCPHEGQVKFIENSEASINVLACSNRYGKTTLLSGEHFHACIYKTGAEPRFMDDDGTFNLRAYRKTKYRTVHTAGEWEQAKEVWDDAHVLINECPRLKAFIADAPKSVPPHIEFINGAKWLFRTLGVNASNIDGKSFYLLSIDEAGWIKTLLSMLHNVLRIRVADVRGRIHLVGTFKPGMSKDFFKVAVRAAAQTGAQIGFDHRSDDGVEGKPGGLDPALVRYAKECGLDLEGEARRLGILLDEAA